MYSISSFGDMIADETRTDAYVTALQRSIRPETTTVLDIGTGTGIFALLACRFGARHVYALEPGEAIHVARQLATENGYADKITFIQDFSTRISLPQPVDVIISDLHGVLPFFQQHIPSIVDARQRLLAPNGILIPQRDTVMATVVTAPEQYADEYLKPWIGNKYDLKMQAARRVVINQWDRGKITPEQFLAEAKEWTTLNYQTITSTDIAAKVSWKIEQAGVGHGLSLWFETEVAEGLHLSNAPGLPPHVYGNAFFPWSDPVELAVGDEVQVLIQANLVGDDYIWRWNTQISSQSGDKRTKANFKQSTFHSALLSPGQLAKTAATHVASLSEDGRIDGFILGQMATQQTLGEIADLLFSNFPSQFANRNEALGRVGKLSQKYSRA